MFSGKNLSRILLEQNIKQKDFAECLFISPSTLCDYIHGRRTPSLDLQHHMSKLLGVTFHDLQDSSVIHKTTDSELLLLTQFRNMTHAQQQFILKIAELLPTVL